MTLPIQLPQIGTTGVVQQPSLAELLAPLFQGLEARRRAQELDLQKQQLAEATQEHRRQVQEHEAAQRADAALGEGIRNLFLSAEPQQMTLPPGSVPSGAASQSPI